MNWFEEQLTARRQSDADALGRAYEAAVNAIIGQSFSFDESEDDLNLILRYYRLEPVELPDEITDDNERLSAMCRLSGLMQRPVRLERGWHKNAFGAMLCRLRDGSGYVAAIPGEMGGYSYYDKKNHRRVKLNSINEQLLGDEAICFYRPLPAKSLTVPDIVKFSLSSWHTADYAVTIALLAATTLVGMLVPMLNNFLYSTVIEEGSLSLLMSTLVFILSVNISTLLLTTVKSVFDASVGVRMSAELKSASMMRMLSLPVNFFRQYSSGEIMTRMGYIESISSRIVTMIFTTSLSSLFSLAYIFRIGQYTPALVLPSIGIILANVLFTVYTTLRQTRITKRQMELSAKNSGKSIEMISGIQKIKMSGSEKRMFARYTTELANEMRITYNPPLFNKYNTVIAQAISFCGTLIIYYMAVKSDVNVAEYYAFQTSYGMISAAIAALAGIALQAAQLRPSLEMVKPLLAAVPENHERAQDVTSLSGNIEISNITFRYTDSSPDVIKDFSLKIKQHQYVAIVGKTGCGKSTLVRLLLGFEKPQKGSIYYDGKDISLLEKTSLRRKIGTVMQDDRLFNGDIYSNIVICAPTLTIDDAWEAAETAGIAEDIRNMPMGMFTMISEGSGGISGGQRQRLVIARAIAPKPKILIFDEATSALDNITQKKVTDALDSLQCTRIIIAHRLSTIRNCDRIIVMDSGRIIEDGSYDELIAHNGYFADLVSRQRLDSGNEEQQP